MNKQIIIFIGIFLIGFSMNTTQAQNARESKYGSDSSTCVINNSLEYEFYKQWKVSNYKNESWKDAIVPWRWVFKNCPASTKNIYLHGEKLIGELIKHAPDKETKNKYIDTLMLVYDNRIQYFGKEGFVLGKKGSDLYKLSPTAYAQAYGILKKSVELEGNNSKGPVLIYYFKTAIKMVKNSEAEKSVLVDIYDETSEIVEYNLKKYTDKGDTKKVTNWENVRGNIELSFEPYATCEDLVSLYTVKYNETPDNLDLLKKITKILDKKNCTDTELFRQATESLYKLEPNSASAELLGKMYIKKEQFDKAAKYLNEAIGLCEDNNERADINYLLANVYMQQKKYAAARSQCYEVLKVRPNDGKSYILIGDLYVSSAKLCGGNDLTDRAAYWPAVDKYIKAKNVDPSVADLANTKIKTFKQYFPATETIFFYDLKVGDSYTVECWINETTTVRVSD